MLELDGATEIAMQSPTVPRMVRFQVAPPFAVRETASANWNEPPLQNTELLLGSETIVLPSEKGLAIIFQTVPPSVLL
jgi:hypothetical protein